MSDRAEGMLEGSPAELYERYFVPSIGAPIAEDLMEVAALRPGERVLDVACGTGVVTRLAAAQVGPSGAVAGLDLNPGMLAVARSTAPRELAIEWHEASAEAMPLADESFDVVLCQMGLQFFPDRLGALREVRRVLRPSGRAVFNVPGPTPRAFEIMADGLARHVAPPAAQFVHAVFSMHDPDELRDLVARAGLKDIDAQVTMKTLRLPPPEDFLWQYIYSTPLAAAVTASRAEQRAALAEDVFARWQDLVVDGALRVDVRMLTVSASK